MSSEKWEDNGVVPNISHDIYNIFVPVSDATDTHKVTNTETGQEKYVRVDPGQTTGEAIANGQWECED